MFRVLLCAGVLALGLVLPVSAAKPLREQPVGQLPQWQDFSVRQTKSLEALAACEHDRALCDSAEMERWSGLVSGLRGQNKLRQMITVNRWFNRLPYQYDDVAYDKADHWSDTRELLLKRGDCEDFALAKYYTLRALGFAAEELKVTMVYDQEQYLNHAVLMVYSGETRYMMDINGDDMSPSPMEYRYKTLYSFNERTAWFY